MIIAGLDCGNAYTKAVLMDGTNVIAKAKVSTDFDISAAANAALSNALSAAGVTNFDKIGVTGAARQSIDFADKIINEVSSAAKGAAFVDPDVTYVLDIGAESYRALRVREHGKVLSYENNDRCAAGSGTFVETMARTLEVSIDELGKCALNHTQDISIAAQCVVFAESEVISLIHSKTPIEDIAYGVLSGVATRVATVAKREAVSDKAMLIGGLGGMKSLVTALSDAIGARVYAPSDPQYVSAIGAAVTVAEA